MPLSRVWFKIVGCDVDETAVDFDGDTQGSYPTCLTARLCVRCLAGTGEGCPATRV